ncbi:MAG: SDR family NAD(P)-dependent oxidoreductase [Gemmatimonadota bacterium]
MHLTDLRNADVLFTDVGTRAAEAAALALAEAGARVWLVSARSERLHEVVDRVVAVGGHVDFRVMDLSSLDEVADLVVDVRAKAPRLRAVVDTGGPLTVEGLDALARGMEPGLSAEGGALLLLSEGTSVPRVSAELVDHLRRRSVAVHALLGGADPPEKWGDVVQYLSRLSGDAFVGSFEDDALARALSTHGEEYVAAHLGELAGPLPLLHSSS